MRDIAATAQRLRAVREAQRRFLGLWAAHCLFDNPRSLDRMATDLEQSSLDPQDADPFDHDWSRLYRGSVLDD
jgi:hypothetical protein